jgi:hypothetical protein
MHKLNSSACLVISILALGGCGEKEDPSAFKKGTTMAELKAQSAKIAATQAADEARREKSAGSVGLTALSAKISGIDTGWTRTAVIGVLGTPANVITPGKLKANDIDRGPDIEYVLTWDNPGCSRIEVFFNARNKVTGTDAGQMCAYPMKPLANTYSCSKPSNAKYCR